MHAYMNKEVLKLTIEKNEAHYYSRSRDVFGTKVQQADLFKKLGDLIDDRPRLCVA